MRNANLLNHVVNFNCPHCEALCAFTCTYSARGRLGNVWYPVSVWACQSCDRAIFVRGQTTVSENSANTDLHIETIYPSTIPTAPEHVPPGIADDFVEAAKDYNVGSFKSSVVMARRTIQKTCLNLGAKKNARLVDQIKELKGNGKLHSDLAEMATEIRWIGNDGAHPENDGLDEVEGGDAKEILDFTSELLDDLFVRPKKVAAMRERREQKKKANATA